MKDFIMLDGTLKTLPKLECNLTVQDFLEDFDNKWVHSNGSILSSPEYDAESDCTVQYRYDFEEITQYVENLLLLDEHGGVHRGCLDVTFTLWLNDNGIEKAPYILWAVYDEEELIEYWYPNLYGPNIPVVEWEMNDFGDSLDEINENQIKIVGWKYDDI